MSLIYNEKLKKKLKKNEILEKKSQHGRLTLNVSIPLINSHDVDTGISYLTWTLSWQEMRKL